MHDQDEFRALQGPNKAESNPESQTKVDTKNDAKLEVQQIPHFKVGLSQYQLRTSSCFE